MRADSSVHSEATPDHPRIVPDLDGHLQRPGEIVILEMPSALPTLLDRRAARAWAKKIAIAGREPGMRGPR